MFQGQIAEKATMYCMRQLLLFLNSDLTSEKSIPIDTLIELAVREVKKINDPGCRKHSSSCGSAAQRILQGGKYIKSLPSPHPFRQPHNDLHKVIIPSNTQRNAELFRFGENSLKTAMHHFSPHCEEVQHLRELYFSMPAFKRFLTMNTWAYMMILASHTNKALFIAPDKH